MEYIEELGHSIHLLRLPSNQPQIPEPSIQY